jgi:hypothetical protein
VLPVCWRHLLDFPRKGVRQNRREHDIGEAFGEEEEYPSLEDITVEGVPFVRSLITDLALVSFDLCIFCLGFPLIYLGYTSVPKYGKTFFIPWTRERDDIILYLGEITTCLPVLFFA